MPASALHHRSLIDGSPSPINRSSQSHASSGSGPVGTPLLELTLLSRSLELDQSPINNIDDDDDRCSGGGNGCGGGGNSSNGRRDQQSKSRATTPDARDASLRLNKSL